jgi:hypothetical protein
MIKMKTILSLITMMMTIAASSAYTDDTEKKPAILGGKIWSGSDTLDLGKNDISDSLDSQRMKGEDDFFSGNLIELSAKDVSIGTEILKLKLSIPRTLKFIDNAPVVLKAKSSDPNIIEIGEGTGTNPEKGFIFPVSVNPGTADLFLYYKVVCCLTEGREACFFKEAGLKIPVTVGDFEDNIIKIRHEIDD